LLSLGAKMAAGETDEMTRRPRHSTHMADMDVRNEGTRVSMSSPHASDIFHTVNRHDWR